MTSQFLIDEFTQQFTQAFEMMAGERPSVKAAPAALPDSSGLTIWEQNFNLEGSHGWFAGSPEAWTDAGSRLLVAVGISDADPATAKSTLTEILNQAFSGVARAVTARVQGDLTATTSGEIETAPGGIQWHQIDLQIGDSNPATFFLAFGSQFAEIRDRAAAETTELAPITGTAPRSIASSVENSKTLDLLLDVELPVSVSFGRAQLPLRDVIKLTTGSIVELNRTVGEPVEVIVNNCVIARGEVVVVEGNFGVRVQQVISKQDRLRTLY